MISKNVRRIISTVLVLLMLCSSMLFAKGTDYLGHWAEKSIQNWIDKGYVKGYQDGTFKPENDITRAEFMAIVNRSLGFTAEKEVSYKDVKESHWAYNEFKRANAAGYIGGFEDGTLRPNNKITRQEVAAIMARLLNLKDAKGSKAFLGLNDVEKIPEWSKGVVSAIVDKGYMKLRGKDFAPTLPATRAEVIDALNNGYLNFVKIKYNKAGTYTAGVVDGSVEINVKDVILEDTIINGNLIIAEAVGSGNVTLKNVVVKGDAIVKGGGMNSIIIEDSDIRNLIIEKIDGKIRILAKGSSYIDNVDMRSGGKLQANDNNLGYIVIAENLSSDEPIILMGNFDNVEIRSGDNEIQVQSGTIKNLEIAKTAKGAKVNLAAGAKVEEVEINAAALIDGKGEIGTATVNAEGVKIIEPVDPVKKASGVDKVEIIKPSTSGGGGGSSGSGSITPIKVKVSAITVNKSATTLTVGATETITATVEPGDASNKNVTWTSSKDAIATVDANGKITAVAVGEAVITVTSVADSSKKATVGVTVKAETLVSDFVFDASTKTITGYTGTEKSVAIPAKIGEIDVEVIGNKAFANKGLTSVVIPNSVTSIGKHAFIDNKLTSVVIPDSVTSIKQGAFSYNELTSINIPNSITTIEKEVFEYNKLTSIVIPDSVTTIGQWAFLANELTSIEIPNSVATIGASAFLENELTSILIPNSVTSIGVVAFNDNQLPDDQAFIYARKSDGAEDKSKIVSYGGAKRENVIIPDSVKTIGEAAFMDNELLSITIPNSVTTIEDYAFGGNKLTEVTIPISVTNLGDGAFEDNGLEMNTTNSPTGPGTWEIKDSSEVWTKKGVVSVSAISVEPKELTLTAGGATGTITATVSPAGATNKAVTWTSSNGAVATVVNGVVTPVAAGTATITATTVDGSFTATTAVTVEAAPDVDVTATNSIANATPKNINVALNKAVTGLVKGDFAVTKGGAAYTDFTVTETDGQNYILVMDDAAVNTDVFTVTITKTGYAFTGTAVTNNVAAPDVDVTATNSIANATPKNINVALNKAVTGLVKGDFAVTKGGAAYTDFTVTETDGQNYILVMDDAAVNTDVFTVTITKTGYAFAGQAVTNNVPAPPAAAPTVVGAVTNAAGDTITIEFSKAMADPAGKHAEFSFNDGGARTFSAAALNADNTKIDLTVDGAAIANGATVTVSYTEGTVVAADTGVLATFAGQAVTNNVPAPPAAAPTVVGAVTNAAGDTITIEFSKAMADPAGKHAEFSFNDGGARTFSAAALNADNTKIDLTVDGAAIANGATVTVSYTEGTVVAADTGVLATFAGQAVTNNVPAPPAAAPTVVGAVTNAAGDTITIEFSKAMADPAGKHAEFSFNDGGARTFSAAALNADNTKIDLTVDGAAIANGATVTVSYTEGTVVAADTGVLATFAGQAVTNNVPAPPAAAPTVVGAVTNAAGDTITIEFSKAMADPAGKHAEFSFNDGGARTFSAAALNADNTKIDLTVDGAAIANGATVTVSYTEGTVVAADTGVLATFAGQAVTNNVPAPPAAAPTVVGAVTNAAGDTITIEFSKAMADPAGKHAEFSFNDGGARTFSAAALNADNTKIDLTVDGAAIANGATVTVSYTEGTVVAADTGVLATFAGQAVTNNVPAPPAAAPTVVGAVTNAAGDTITIEFSKAMADPAGKHAEFSFNDGGARTFSAAALNADNTKIDLTVDGAAIANGATVTVSYTEGTVVAADTGVLATFAGQAVTNNVPAPPAAAPTVVGAVTNAAGDTITIEFSKAMADPAGKHAEFSFNDGGARTFSAAALNADNTKIDLTVDGAAIANGATVTVSYTEGTVVAADTGVLATFAGQAVTNNVPAPPAAAPTVVGAVTNAAGDTITIEFSKAMADPAGKHAEFSFNDGGARTFSAAALNADNTKIDLTVDGAAIANGATVTVSYTEGTVVAADTGVLATFAGQAVTNNVPAPDVDVVATNSIADATPSNIDVSLDVAVTGLVKADFAVTKGGPAYEDFTVTETDGNNYILVMADAAVSTDVFTVTITKAGYAFTGTAVTNNVAALVDAVAPVITADLSDKTTTVGSAVTLDATATVTDGGTVSYVWYSATAADKTGAAVIADQTGATYAPPVDAAGTFYYYAVVTNTNNSATGTKTAETTSAVATVTVAAASDAKAITATTVGTLDGGNIINVPAETKVSALKAGLTVSDKAKVEILVGTGGAAVADQENTDVTATMVIQVTAEDGTKAEYTIAMAAPSIDPDHLSFSAATNKFTVAAAAPTGTYKIFFNESDTADTTEVSHTTGTESVSEVVVNPGTAGENIHYTFTDTDKEESEKTADGVIVATLGAPSIVLGHDFNENTKNGYTYTNRTHPGVDLLAGDNTVENIIEEGIVVAYSDSECTNELGRQTITSTGFNNLEIGSINELIEVSIYIKQTDIHGNESGVTEIKYVNGN